MDWGRCMAESRHRKKRPFRVYFLRSSKNAWNTRTCEWWDVEKNKILLAFIWWEVEKNKILLAFIKNKELLHEAVITGNFYLFQYQSDSSCRRDGWSCCCANIPIAAKPANRRWHSCACLKVRINHRWYGWGLSRCVQREEHHHRSAPEVLRTRYPSGKVIPHDCYLTERESIGTLFCCMYVQSPARSQSFNAQHCPAA